MKAPFNIGWFAVAILVAVLLSLLVLMIVEHESTGRRLWLSLRQGIIVSSAIWLSLDARDLFTASSTDRDLQELRSMLHILIAFPRLVGVAVVLGAAYFGVVCWLRRNTEGSPKQWA